MKKRSIENTWTISVLYVPNQQTFFDFTDIAQTFMNYQYNTK